MIEYLKITPNGQTHHIVSKRIKRFGAVERPVTYCGLWVHPHSVTVELEEVPAKLCPACRKRSQTAAKEGHA
jgi:hypothetical protein